MDKKPSQMRLIIQFAFVALTNGYLKGFAGGHIFTGKSKMFCVPGLNCYSCPGALFSCPLGSMQSTLSAYNYKFAFYTLGIIMFFGALMGRFVCGFLCPFGLVQDLLFKIPFFRKLRTLPGEKYLRFLKYIILVVFVVVLPLVAVDIIGQGSPWFCKYICPSGTLFAGIPLVSANESLRGAVGDLFTWKVALLAVFCLSSILLWRPFCRYICPLGALYGLMNPVALKRYSVDKGKCTKCGKCQQACKMDIPVYEKPNSVDCVRCGACKEACPYECIK